MNKRVKKKAEKRIRRDIHKALDIVLDINGLGVRKQSVTGNLPTAFFDFSGHTADVDIYIHKKGWKYHGDSDHNFSQIHRMDSLLVWLEEMKKELGC